MKPNLKISLVYLLIGVISMLNGYGCSSALKFEKYSSKDPELNINIDYISGWLHSETRGSYGSYAQVLFYEPQRKDKNLKAGIVVTVKNISKVDLGSASIEAFAKDLVAKRMELEDAKVISALKIKLLNTEAMDIGLAYKSLDKLYGVDAKLIPVKERVVILKKNDKFYILRYENTAVEFDKFSRAFSHIIKTLRFKDSK